MGFFSKAGPAGNESGGWVNGKHRGQPAKGKGGVGKPTKGRRNALAKGKAKGKPGGYYGDILDRWG